MARFRFRRDTAVWTADDKEISLMILSEHPWGCTYLGRKKRVDGKRYIYATASYHENQHQFVNGPWFASGFTGGTLTCDPVMCTFDTTMCTRPNSAGGGNSG